MENLHKNTMAEFQNAITYTVMKLDRSTDYTF